MSNILEIITTMSYGTNVQHHVVLKEFSPYTYTKHGNVYVGVTDCGLCWDFLTYSPGTKNAFGGREFTVRMSDGTTKTMKDSYWSSGIDPKLAVEISVPDDLMQLGASTPEALHKCNVFSGACMSRRVLKAFLAEHGTSPDYYKYCGRREYHTPENYIKRLVEAITKGERLYGAKPISAQRARKLRKRGDMVHKHLDQWYRFPWRENAVKTRELDLKRNTVPDDKKWWLKD